MALIEAYKELLRRKMMADIYSKMDDDDRKALAFLSEQDSSDDRIMEKLNQISSQIDSNRHTFTQDIAANIAGNFIFDSTVFLVSQLFRRIRP